MKRIIAILLFYSCCSLYSQSWAPIGATWYYDYQAGTAQGYLKIESVKDTLINATTCKKLEKTRITFNHSTGNYDTLGLGFELTYRDSNKVYHLKQDTLYVLYDFNAIEADTWTVFGDAKYSPSCDSVGEIMVDSIGESVVNSDTLKLLYVSPKDTSDWRFSHEQIIEKMGSLGYMFPEPNMCVVDASEAGNLRCYSDTFGTYQVSGEKDCTFITSVNSIKKDNNFEIFPLPFEDHFILKTTHLLPGLSITLYDIQGKIIFSYPVLEKEKVIHTEKLPSGMYFIEMNSSSVQIVRKILKY